MQKVFNALKASFNITNANIWADKKTQSQSQSQAQIQTQGQVKQYKHLVRAFLAEKTREELQEFLLFDLQIRMGLSYEQLKQVQSLVAFILRNYGGDLDFIRGEAPTPESVSEVQAHDVQKFLLSQAQWLGLDTENLVDVYADLHTIETNPFYELVTEIEKVLF